MRGRSDGAARVVEAAVEDWPQEVIRVEREGPDNDFVAFERSQMEQSVGARFERMVALYGARPLIVTPEKALTWDEANARVNTLAHAILSRAGDANDPVAVVLPTGVDAFLAAYGVQKAGKSYTFLDPSYPRARLEFVYGDLEPVLTVTDAANEALARSLAPPRHAVIALDALDYARDGDNPGLAVSPDALNWIMYTSGSTGRPKGVCQSHRVQLHSMMNVINTMRMSPDDRIAQLESFAFTGTIRSYIGGPLAGSTVCLYDVKARGVAGLGEWLEREGVTIWSSVPAVLRHYAEGSRAKRVESMRIVRIGGDRLIASDVEAARECFGPRAIFVNGYGTTESGLDRQCYFRLSRRPEGSIMPLGYAVDDMEILILDEAGNEAPPGEPGEIAIRSRYLTEGYWRSPDLTAERYTADPDDPCLRTYRPGDFGRMLEDGCLVGLGRRDAQVKVRGFRIETAEVEAALRSAPGVAEAVCAARTDASGARRLVGYVVAGAARPSVTELRAALLEKVPDYMVPSAFVFMERLPLTEERKIDAKALPEPSRARPALAAAYRAPVTPVERLLAATWSEILDLDEVGVDDDFLELGGDSLKASTLAARLSAVFDARIEPADLLARATVAAMAGCIVDRLVSSLGEVEAARLVEDAETSGQ